jgi:hypothetical protein
MRGWLRGSYPYGVVCGLLMSVCGYLMRDWDVPVTLVAAVLFAPCFALSGFLTARRRGFEPGVLVGAGTAMISYLVVSLLALGYSAIGDPWPKPLNWALSGLTFLLPMAIFGALCGFLGAALAGLSRGRGHVGRSG